MYISEVHIENFRNFADCRIPLNQGLSVIIGENNIGKSNFLAALALLFSPDASPRSRHLAVGDFWLGITNTDELPEIAISCTLTDFKTDGEKSTVATWMTADPREAKITYVFRCNAKAKKEYKKGDPIPIDEYESVIYGGETESREPFEFDQLNKISLELLGALRDAERDLEPSTRGRIAHLLRNFEASDQDKQDVTKMIEALNARLSKAGQVSDAQGTINTRLKDLVGETSAQETRLTPIGADYDELVRKIEVQVRSPGEEFRGVDWNGLGYNNLLFVSVLLADHLQKWQKKKLVLPMMAIEEPEAHLHPHLQKVLNRNFERTVHRAQVIATTHSTHITSSVSLDSLIVLNRDESGVLQGVKVGDLFKDSKADRRLQKDLERYLDATKSTLFFAKSVLLVEGLAEALIIPILARKCARRRFDLDEEGISIVTVHGLSFRPFLQLFGSDAIRRKCAVLTDSDSREYSLDIDSVTPNPTAACLIQDFGGHDNPYVSIFTNLETFEYDLAVATSGDAKDPDAPLNNEAYFLRALKNTPDVTKKNIPDEGSISQRDEFGKTVLELVKETKGRFAQSLAAEIDEGFLFSVGLEYESDLQTGNLSGGFRQEFESNGITLSGGSGTEPQEGCDEWQITDNNSDRTYTVSKQDELLHIYGESFVIPPYIQEAFDFLLGDKE